MKRLAVFASGRGSNFRAIIDHARLEVLRNVEVALLMINDRTTPVVEVAKGNSIPIEFLEGIVGRKFASKEDREKARTEFDTKAVAVLQRYHIDLIALAGFTQVLGSTVVQAFRWRIMNIHPAKDLVKFGGRGMYGEHVHEAVLRAGEKESGCTIHYVDESVDGGPTIIQTTVPVNTTDTPETLAKRILIQEHRTYSKAIQLHADERLKVSEGRVVIDWSDNWEEDWNRRQERFIEYQMVGAITST
ncbi:MAG: phosphoribosylglycinamide formyltransferase [Candidatus Bathyarchaeia archaeon]|jgi:phosphoribosylglycinamide formyltransferase-1